MNLQNPYVGPKSFEEEERDRFFGREREARDLLAQVVSERLVLFYAQSGAGKTSLLRARLIPSLREQGFDVLPIGRVSGELPSAITPEQVSNIFIFNLILTLNAAQTTSALPVEQLVGVTLAAFLTGEVNAVASSDASTAATSDTTDYLPTVLIIDQFEELLLTHINRWPDRIGFFQQLRQCLDRFPNFWVVLTLREDYVASLDPYVHLLANRLSSRYYMQRLGVAAALDAIQRPAAEIGGRPFTDEAALALVNNLSLVRIAGREGTFAGEYIEPVQLQVVCYQLWEELKKRPLSNSITSDDLQDVSNIERALAEYYQSVLKKVLAEQNLQVSEDILRSWFSTRLITEMGTRGFVLQTEYHTGNLPNSIVDKLEQSFLIRRESRAGGIWYELVHDTFVTPILRSNQEWSLLQASPEIVEFSVTPKVISPGAHVFIQWRIRNAETIRIDPGGLILKDAVGLLRLQADDPLYPKQTTIYRLTAMHSSGLHTASATQEVILDDDSSIQSINHLLEQGLTVLISGQLDQHWLQPAGKPSLDIRLSDVQTNNENLGEQYLNALAERITSLATQRGMEIDADKLGRSSDKLSVTGLAMELDYPSIQSEHWKFLQLLAQLPIEVYITGSYHTFLEESLKAAGKLPQTMVCRWNDEIANLPISVDTEIDRYPSPYKPIVFHLYGVDSHPSSLAITEDDYITFLMRVREDRDVVPVVVRYALQRKYNLILGFDPQSWEFKALYHGLITWNYQRRVGGLMQIMISQDRTSSDIQQIKASIVKSGLKVFWSDTSNLLLLVKPT